jgi:hypothetical protein
MINAHPLNSPGMGSRRRSFKRLFKNSGLAGSVGLFMLLCVIIPTIIIQRGFSFIAAWELLLAVLLCLSLQMTREADE